METVESLHDRYSRRLRADGVSLQGEIRRLSQQYYDRWELTAQAVASGAAVAVLVETGAVDPSAIDGAVREAFELAYPNVPVESLADASAEQLAGYVSAWKGKLFEVQVRDQLNAGQEVGGVQLEAGQRAELAASANQPGWDLQILNEDGTVAEAIQLKATESLSYVREALERYPDYHVVATSNLADSSSAAAIQGLSTAGVSEEELQQAIEAPLEEIGGTDIWDVLLPGLPFLLIATRQGLAVFSGEKGWSSAMATALEDGVKTGAAIAGGLAAGAVATAVGGEVLSDIAGDMLADALLGAVLPFGVGFFIRRLFGRSSRRSPSVVGRSVNEDFIRDWVMPRAIAAQRGVAKYYLPPPAR